MYPCIQRSMHGAKQARVQGPAATSLTSENFFGNCLDVAKMFVTTMGNDVGCDELPCRKVLFVAAFLLGSLLFLY